MRERMFSRQELYDLVWAEPMTVVAKRLGLSGRGLAKACARGDIHAPVRARPVSRASCSFNFCFNPRAREGATAFK